MSPPQPKAAAKPAGGSVATKYACHFGEFSARALKAAKHPHLYPARMTPAARANVANAAPARNRM